MPHVTIVYYSVDDSIYELAQYIKNGIRSRNMSVSLMNIESYDMGELLRSDTIVFGCPTTMGGISGQFKIFMDLTSGHWHNQTLKNKLAAGFTTGPINSERMATLQTMSGFAGPHSMLWISQGHLAENEGRVSSELVNRQGSYLGMIGDSTATLIQQSEDNQTAYYFGIRIANITLRCS